ncbi:MAG: DUF2180 family protein [Methanoregula sp.]
MTNIIALLKQDAAASARIAHRLPQGFSGTVPAHGKKRSGPGTGRRMKEMKCYICAKEGTESDAVAVCVACGMGTCMKHTIRKEVDVWEGGYPLPSQKLPKKMPRMLCPDCNKAYKGEK